MSSVNDQVQKLFDEHENKVHNYLIEHPEEDRDPSPLDEIQTLRHHWDRHKCEWVDGLDHERKRKERYYLQMFEDVRNKLAMKTETVTDGDYWWTPPQHKETVNLLWSIAATLRKPALPWSRHIPRVTYVVTQRLLYLGILVALLLSSHSTFETKVIASLVLIYNHVTLQGIDAGVDLVHLRKTMGEELSNVARTMKLKAPVDSKTSEDHGMGILLAYVSGISVQLGSLIAVVALVWSFF